MLFRYFNFVYAEIRNTITYGESVNKMLWRNKDIHLKEAQPHIK